MSDIERRIAQSAPDPTRPLDPAQVWRRAQRRRHRRLSAVTAGAASLVLLAGAGLVATETGTPRPVVDAPDEPRPQPPDDTTPEDPADEDGNDHEDGQQEADVSDGDEQHADGSGVDNPQPADQLAGREFVATEIRDHDRRYDLAEGTWLHLTFVDDPGDLQVQWHAGCHEHRTPVTVTEQRLEVGEMTLVQGQECTPTVEEQEQWMRGLLSAGPRWELEGSGLHLRSGEAIVAFEEGPPPEPEEETSDPSQHSGVEALAKSDGFRDGLDGSDVRGVGLLEIAYDQQTAERAWEQNVPDDLAEREGEPAEPGRYGHLDQVDFDHQALVVWHAGESGSCPAWLDDVHADEAGDVHVEVETTAGEGEFCTDDYNPYRMVLVVDHDRLPDPDQLPRETTRDSDHSRNGRVTAYP